VAEAGRLPAREPELLEQEDHQPQQRQPGDRQACQVQPPQQEPRADREQDRQRGGEDDPEDAPDLGAGQGPADARAGEASPGEEEAEDRQQRAGRGDHGPPGKARSKRVHRLRSFPSPRIPA